MPRYLIIGAGVFGASTALHTKKEEPSADVLLFDHTPSYVTPASVDINKIVRTQYAAREYHELANEAVKAWLQTDFVDLYNKSGWIIIGGSGGEGSLGHSDDQNARMLVGGDPRWSPIFSFPEDQMAVWDPEPAWVDATSALERTVTLACKAGVKYKRAAVSTLILSGNRCIGVRLADGEDITGDRILLSMGPWTAPFLARHSSLPNFAEQCVNAGASSATITVDKAQEHLYRNMPILVCHPNGEIMPMDRKRRIKVTNAITFTNSELGSLGPSELGDPRSHLFEENRALLSKFLPQFSETPFSEVRYC
ncbi:MAG: hypothetical protein M1814_003052 [Vezdaea aestivalis]|nr:MAG: hypothetical protein M1814_003052 [Vezdaea aestivalis]